jgi:hypothetical protein
MVATLYFPLRIIYELNSIRAWMKNSFPEPNCGWVTIKDFGITVIITVCCLLMKKLMFYSIWDFFYSRCKEKND